MVELIILIYKFVMVRLVPDLRDWTALFLPGSLVVIIVNIAAEYLCCAPLN